MNNILTYTKVGLWNRITIHIFDEILQYANINQILLDRNILNDKSGIVS